ncbi:MAG TPA: hypothetical protein VNR86_08045, partial [Sphingomicrobium sp.]|nr:hypothetical protein [Sphingomicrobium sp.]
DAEVSAQLAKSLTKQGLTVLTSAGVESLKAEAVARERDGDNETLVAEGEFTFVALDEKNQPRSIVAEEESNG